MANWYAIGAVLLLMALVIGGWFVFDRGAAHRKPTRRHRGPDG